MTALNPMSAHAWPATGQIVGFDVIQTLGTGAASCLYLVHDTQGAAYTLKYVPINSKKDHRFADQAISEHKIAQRFDDPRIRKSLRIHKIRSVLRLTGVAVVLEHVDGHTLNSFAGAKPSRLYPLFLETAAALDVMHQAGYVHADLKPNNIMATRPQQRQPAGVKLIDLGQSCPTGTVKPRIQGTPDYMAPEQAKRRPIDERTDIYCLAATMYNLLTGKTASSGLPDRPDVGMVVASTEDRAPRDPIQELNSDVPPALAALLADCLAHRPADRPESMTRVIERLEIAVQQTLRATG